MIYPKYKQLKRYKKLFITILIVFALANLWYGIWHIYDLHLAPAYPTLTAIVTIVAGVVILAITHYSLS